MEEALRQNCRFPSLYHTLAKTYHHFQSVPERPASHLTAEPSQSRQGTLSYEESYVFDIYFPPDSTVTSNISAGSSVKLAQSYGYIQYFVWFIRKSQPDSTVISKISTDSSVNP